MPTPKASFTEDMNEDEWECRACGCINHDDDERCWNCNADVDGQLMEAALD